jgi:hypothetical protein
MQNDLALTVQKRVKGSIEFVQYKSLKDVSNEDLKFSLDVLSLRKNPNVSKIEEEIFRRIQIGTWLDIESSVPTTADQVPALLHIWPLSLFWSQRPR